MSAPIFKLTLQVKRAGQLADADATPTLSDAGATYGVRRADTQAVVVAAGTAMTRDGLGLYSYTLASYVQGLTYEYSTAATVGGRVYYYAKRLVAPVEIVSTDDGSGAYLTIAQADALAATLPGLPAYRALSDVSKKSGFLLQASDDVDNGMRYQGRKYDPTKARQFPRIQGNGTWPVGGPWVTTGQTGGIWDWDSATDAAVVPADVLKAVLYQADYLAAGAWKQTADMIHAGITLDQGGGTMQQYNAASAGAKSGLCREAYQIMQKYRLRSGALL